LYSTLKTKVTRRCSSMHL